MLKYVDLITRKQTFSIITQVFRIVLNLQYILNVCLFAEYDCKIIEMMNEYIWNDKGITSKKASA